MFGVSGKKQLLLRYEQPKELFHFDPETGVIFTGWGSRRNQSGYIQTGINELVFTAHGVAGFNVYRECSEDQADNDNNTGKRERLQSLFQDTTTPAAVVLQLPPAR